MGRRSYAPGQHGQSRKKVSEYGIQLRAKQKARRFYGVLERQFANYFEIAASMPGMTGENLLRILESRLDNVVYRHGIASTHAQDSIKNNDKIKALVEANSARPVPKWLEIDRNTLQGKVLNLPNREDIDLQIEEHLIVELYSK